LLVVSLQSFCGCTAWNPRVTISSVDEVHGWLSSLIILSSLISGSVPRMLYFIYLSRLPQSQQRVLNPDGSKTPWLATEEVDGGRV
jgi:hypothetical protein